MTLKILKTVGSPAPKKSLARRARREVNHTYAWQGLFHPFSSLGVTAETRLSYGSTSKRPHKQYALCPRERKLDYRYKRGTRNFLLLFLPPLPPSIFFLFTVYQICKCRSWGHMTAVVMAAPTEGRKTHVDIFFNLFIY